MGLGERGKDKVKEAAAPELFRMTEPLADVHSDIHTGQDYKSTIYQEANYSDAYWYNNNIDTKIYKPVKADTHKSVLEKNDQRKLFNFSFSLSERLRKCAYETRRKEAEIVREALDEWLKNHDY